MSTVDCFFVLCFYVVFDKIHRSFFGRPPRLTISSSILVNELHETRSHLFERCSKFLETKKIVTGMIIDRKK